MGRDEFPPEPSTPDEVGLPLRPGDGDPIERRDGPVEREDDPEPEALEAMEQGSAEVEREAEPDGDVERE